MTDSRVLGFVGVGRMGGPMASRLLDAGHQLVVFDTSADATAPLAARGVRVAASAGEVASLAPIVFVSLPTPPIVQSVALSPGGLISGTARIVIDVSTTGPGVAGTVAKAMRRVTPWITSRRQVRRPGRSESRAASGGSPSGVMAVAGSRVG